MITILFFMSAQKSKQEALIFDSIDKEKILSVKTYFLSDYGEKLIHKIISTILTKYNRMDLLDMSYSAAKELVINGTKANLKRVVFKDLGLDIYDPNDYAKGMLEFKDNLAEEKVIAYKPKFKKYDLPVICTMYFNQNVLNIKVKNNFPLLAQEEEKIRTKFDRAKSFSSLIDFFMEHGDESEGAGLGLTMVGIMLDESGANKHSFSLYSSQEFNETVAKIEIPLNDDYKLKREVFEEEWSKSGLSKEEFRKKFSYTYKEFEFVNS
ncbi:hypothetical protein [Leptospira sp. GIMC2001]|uniref:hypothetical protein n=1 Tax=Leptospira sp. GIMC2001 TaxID=1513297 RepID=UPI002349A271|nr:hypothetical protein [Leptospira sp. GIMC2001]WCL48786.1 hypothetical protein O4O04_15970 [Leptospira sp. GIMC2001]